MLWIDFLLRLPAFLHDVSVWTNRSDESSDDVSIDHKFVLHLLTVVLPELKLVYFPLGTLMLLPCRCQRHKTFFFFAADDKSQTLD